MKKTLLAITVTSLFVTNAFSATVDSIERYTVQDVQNQIDKVERNGAVVHRGQNAIVVVNPIDGRSVTFTQDGDEYKVYTQSADGERNRYDIETNARGSISKIKDINGNDFSSAAIKDVTINGGKLPTPEFDKINVSKSDVEHVAKYLKDTNNIDIADGKVYATTKLNGKDTKIEVGEVMDDGSVVINDASTGESIRIEVDANGDATHVNYTDGQGNNTNAKIVDNDMKPMPTPEDPSRQDIANNRNEISDMKSWAAQAEQKFTQEVKRLDSKIDRVEGRVSNGVAMVGAMSQMQFGQGGFGIGAGAANFNGSNALAIGAGYNFGQNQEWIIKGSLGYAETNKGDAGKIKDTMLAGGVTYTFK